MYVAFTHIKTFGHRLQESALHNSNAFDPYAVAIRESANVNWTRSSEDFCCAGARFLYREEKESRTKDILMEKGDVKLILMIIIYYYMKIILAKFIFSGLVIIRQFAKFAFPPKFAVIQYMVTVYIKLM